MYAVRPAVKSRFFAFLADMVLKLTLHLLNYLLNPARVNPAVLHEALDGAFGDLSFYRVKSGKRNRAGRIVNNNIYACGYLERAYVAALAAAYSALHIVIREVYNADRCLNGVFRGAFLYRQGQYLARLLI